MKIIVAPDKFKGSLTSFEVCNAIKGGIDIAGFQAEVVTFPMADGGDGFAKVMKHYLKTTTVQCSSSDPLGRPIESAYEWNPEGKEAIIELAACSGLELLKKQEKNPLITSTYGTGLQIKHALEKGAQKITLGLGGSATNDAGTGILAALGFRLLDSANEVLRPSGENLMRIGSIVPPSNVSAAGFTIACDVNNPLYGPEGAARVFSPQKGATPQQVMMLDHGLKHFAEVIMKHTGKNVSSIPGAGAAGGIAAGLMGYFNIELKEGTGLIIRASGIMDAMNGADLVITGEGKIDEQSSRGKIVSAICRMANRKKIPVIGLCGKLELTRAQWRELGLSFALEIGDPSMNEEESMTNAFALLKEKARHLPRYLEKINEE